MKSKKKQKQIHKIIGILLTTIILAFVSLNDYTRDIVINYAKKLQLFEDNTLVVSDIDIDDYDLSIHVLSVECADCIIIETEDECYIIDGATPEFSEYILTYVQERGIEKIDGLIVTHADYDHYSGLTDLIEEVEIETFYSTGQEGENITYQDLLELIDEKEISSEIVTFGDYIESDILLLEIVAPINYYEDDKNNMSIVLKLTYNEFTALFTGDAEVEEISDIIESQADIDCDLLKISHHGSANGTNQALLSAVTPDVAVISTLTGEYNFPAEEVITLLDINDIEYYQTDLVGTVVFCTNGDEEIIILTQGE